MNSLHSKFPLTAWTDWMVEGGEVKEENDTDQEERGWGWGMGGRDREGERETKGWGRCTMPVH